MIPLSNTVAGLVEAFNQLTQDAKKISELEIKPAGIVGADEIPISTTATVVTEKITMETLLSYVSTSITIPDSVQTALDLKIDISEK